MPWCSLSRLGYFLRQYRAKNGLTTKDMADALGFKSARLSAIEFGREPLPDDFVEKLTSTYKLSQLELRDLNNALN